MKTLSLLFACVLATSLRAEVVAVRNVTVIDGTGAVPRRNVTVVVRDRRIVDVATRVKVPRGARVVDGRGKFLIPGMWDMHAHVVKAGEHTLPLFIANGVTSVRDMGGEWAKSLTWREEIARGTRLGPRIKSAGPILESAANIERMRREKGVEPFERARLPVGTAEEAEAMVARVVELGGDFVKVRTIASEEVYRAIAAAAKKRGLMLFGHSAGSPELMLEAGQKTVEHALYSMLQRRDDADRKAVFARMAAAGMAVTPTLVLGEYSLFVDNDRAAAIVEDREGKLDPLRRYVGGYPVSDWREQAAERKADGPNDFSKIVPLILQDYRDMHAAGVTLFPGTDVGVLLIYPGFSLADELEQLVRHVGLTPMEALVNATRKPAELFGMEQDLGTIERGKLADLVLLDADPLADIRNAKKVRAVVANGKLFDRKALDRMLAQVESAARQLPQ